MWRGVGVAAMVVEADKGGGRQMNNGHINRYVY